MASQYEDSSESDTEPAKCFHRRLSTNKGIRYNSFIKEGFLSKQNGSFQRWHKRYFKLKSGVLYYAKDKKSTIFNQIDLIDSSIAERSLKNINHSFQVITPFRNLVLCASSRGEMKEWVSAIRAVSSKDFREVTSEMAELSSLSDHHNWCVLPNIRPIFCNVCAESLHKVTRNGVTIHGLACEVCKYRTHKKCASKSSTTCKWTTLASMGGNIIEDQNGDLLMPHQWMIGNFPVSSRCVVCEKACSGMLRLQDHWCLWCHCTVHTSCKDQTLRCNLGPARVSILPPISITNFDEGGFWSASKSPSTSPLLVFLNSKSGDSQGVKMLRRFKQLLNPAQVFDLMNGGPKMGLRLFQNFESFRVLVCGGDGSVGWVLNEIDRLGLHKQCQVGVLPLGTGNDLSRVLGWGASFDDDTQLPALLAKLEHAQIQMFDRWSIYSYETDQTRNRSLPIEPICAYEDTASNHLSRILHSESHNVVISSAMVLCGIVQELVSKVGSSLDDSDGGGWGGSGGQSDKDSIAHKCLTLNQKMEALLKTLANESSIVQPEYERKNSTQSDRWIASSSSSQPPISSSSSHPPPASSFVMYHVEHSSPLTMEEPPSPSFPSLISPSPPQISSLSPPPPLSSLSTPPPLLLTSPPPSSSSSSSKATKTNHAMKGISVKSYATLSSNQNTITTSFSSLSSPYHPSSSLSLPPPSSSSSLARASAVTSTCLCRPPEVNPYTETCILSSSPPLPASSSSPPLPTSSSSPLPASSSPPLPASSSSSSPPLPTSSSSLLSSAALASYLYNSTLSSSSFPPTPSSSSSSSQPPSSSSSSSQPPSSTVLISVDKKSKPVSIEVSCPTKHSLVQKSLRVQKGTIRSKEQLMCRANSLKKAIRQIVELTEKAVDEQNHQTAQFDKDNEKQIILPSNNINTHTTFSSQGSITFASLSGDQVLTNPVSFQRSLDDPPPKIKMAAANKSTLCNGNLVAPSIVISSSHESGSCATATLATTTHSTTTMTLSTTTTTETITRTSECLTLKSSSRETTPIIFNYQLSDNLPYLVAPPITGSTPTSTEILKNQLTNQDLLTLTYAMASPRPASQVLGDESLVSPGHLHSRARHYVVTSPDVPSVSVVDDSILDNEVSQVMHDINGLEKNHLVVPSACYHSNQHRHQPPSPTQPSTQYHHDCHHSNQRSLSNHTQQQHFFNQHHLKESSSLSPNTFIAQHHLHVYSSSDGEASRSSTPHSPLNFPPNLVDRWSPLFGMSADRTNTPSPYFFDHQIDQKPSGTSPSKACPSHAGSGRHLSSLSTLYRNHDKPPVIQSGLKNQQKGDDGVQFPLLNMPLLQSLPKQVMGKGRKSSPIHSSLISRALMANADALCAPASPLNDLENINLDDFTEKCVMNNYFGIGLDAKITLDFHNKREEQPHKCRSRTKNMMWYGVLGGKEILQRTHKNLDQKVRLECDGKLIPLPNLQGIVILNIPSYMGGTNFWGGSKEDEYFIAPSFDDKVLEVVAVFGSIQLGISRVINIQRHRIAQCRTVRITIIGDEGLPVQVDGEAWVQNPGVVWIQHKNRAQVLIRDRAFEEALKNWTEKQKMERTPSREPPLSESEVATLMTYADTTRDLLEKFKVMTSDSSDLELSPSAVVVKKFVDGMSGRTASSENKVSIRVSRSEVMELANHVRSFCYEVRRLLCQKQSLEESDGKSVRDTLEFLDNNHETIYSMGAQFCERTRNKDKLRLLFKLSKSSRKHKDQRREATTKPDALTIRDWSHVEVTQWLASLDLVEYADVFVAHDIRGSELLALGRTDLKELGVVKVGHLKRILQEIKSIKERLKSVEKSRVQNLSEEDSATTSITHHQPNPRASSPLRAPSLEVSLPLLPDVVVT